MESKVSWRGSRPCSEVGFWLDGIVCNGSENSLKECIHLPHGEIKGCSSQTTCVEVDCNKVSKGNA